MRLGKPLAILGVVSIVAAMAVAGTAFAQTPTPTPNQQTKTDYLNVFLDKLAGALGIDRSRLDAAVKTARDQTVDQAVADGRLSQERADRIKAQPGIQGFGFGFGPFGRGAKPFVPRMGGQAVMDAIAGALGMSSQDLMTQLRSGKTLAELAQGKEQQVKDAVVATVKAKLDPLVQSGKITQAQEDQMLDKIRNSDLNRIGIFGKPFGRGFGPKQTPTPGPTGGSAAVRLRGAL